MVNAKYKTFLHSLNKQLMETGKSPVDLAYDLVNEMAVELYHKKNGQEPIEFNLQDPDRVGTDLRKLRKFLGVGQRELARILSISNRPLSDVENGKYIPSLKKIYRYLAGLENAYNSNQ